MKNYELGLILLIKLLLQLINMCGICIEMKKLLRNVITIYVVLMLSLRGFMVYRKFINLLCLFARSFRLSTSPLAICLNFYLVFYQVF